MVARDTGPVAAHTPDIALELCVRCFLDRFRAAAETPDIPADKACKAAAADNTGLYRGWGSDYNR